MNLVMENPEFPTGSSTTLDMRFGGGFVSGVTVQDRSQAGNHGTAVNSPVPSYPGFLFTPIEETGNSYAFAESTPDFIIDITSNFINDGFGDFIGLTIRVDGSANNDGLYTITSVTADVIALSGEDSLVTEAAGPTVTLSIKQFIDIGVVLHADAYPFTIAGWFNISNVVDEEYVILSVGNSATRSNTAIKTHSIMGGLSAQSGLSMKNSTKFTSDNSYITNKWHCLVGTFAGAGTANMNIYIDGLLDNDEGNDVGDDPVDSTVLGHNRSRIGENANDTAGVTQDVPMDGFIGDIIFDRRTWTAAEVKNFFELTRHKYGI